MKYLLIALSLLCFAPSLLKAQATTEDTLVVQTFTFDDLETRRAVFDFPTEGKWRKILMLRTLKCDEKSPWDQYPCGEWDYFTHTVVRLPKGDTTEVFELESFITPYGKRLEMGGEAGWTWIYDVTDYAPLLTGKVDLESGNTQELLDMKFLFISGTPERDIISVENLWDWNEYNYGKLSDDSVLTERKIKLADEAETFKLRARISGHGHYGPRNCCEWDAKTHMYFINRFPQFRWNVWKNCGDNPIYPQGGTWPFDRAGWCPGTKVDTYDFELTPFVNAGDSILVDYAIEPYTDNGEAGGSYRQSHQLFSYGAPNYKNTAAVVDILSPSSKDSYSRVNPSVLGPRIIIRNSGDDVLRTARIVYGVKGGGEYTYQWQGELKFTEEATVWLPAMSAQDAKAKGQFYSRIEMPNGSQDEYSYDDEQTDSMPEAIILPKNFVVHLETNTHGRAKDNTMLMLNSEGKVLKELSDFEDDTTYNEKFSLEKGAYIFRFTDKEEDGMVRHWWNRGSNPDMVGKDGRISIQDEAGNIIHEFRYDFGEELRLEFWVE